MLWLGPVFSGNSTNYLSLHTVGNLWRFLWSYYFFELPAYGAVYFTYSFLLTARCRKALPDLSYPGRIFLRGHQWPHPAHRTVQPGRDHERDYHLYQSFYLLRPILWFPAATRCQVIIAAPGWEPQLRPKETPPSHSDAACLSCEFLRHPRTESFWEFILEPLLESYCFRSSNDFFRTFIWFSELFF